MRQRNEAPNRCPNVMPGISDPLSIHRGTTANRLHPRQRTKIMHKKLSLALTLLMLLGAAPLLGACHTTAGAGQDISAGGNALTNSAEKHTP